LSVKMESIAMSNKTETLQLYNLHTHTFRCKHADGDVYDYTKAADKAGLNLLGFSEHPPLKPEGIWTNYRMDEKDVDGYFSAIKEARPRFPEIEILIGFEMDLYPRYRTYYEDTILHREEVDFLIGGVHWFNYHGEWLTIREVNTAGHLRAYSDELISMMESGIFAFATHPDSFCMGYLSWDENTEACAADILAAAEEYGTPLEINGYGLRKKMINTPEGDRPPYPHPKFWEKASAYNIEVVFNSDAHTPEDTAAGFREGHEIIKSNGLRHHDVNKSLLKFSSENTNLNQQSLSAVP
jgi:histidinol-phosphatase (PHP family)